MLRILGASTSDPATDGPAALLLACHARIRAFTALATRLASADPAPDAEVAAAAQRVHRYHFVALPLHQEDEERSIAPRLEPVAPEPLLAALAAMKRQHVALDTVLAGLLPLWERLAAEPQRRAELTENMAREVGRMEELWIEHLGAEERLIFPALSRLIDEAGLRQIGVEMRARRAASPG